MSPPARLVFLIQPVIDITGVNELTWQLHVFHSDVDLVAVHRDVLPVGGEVCAGDLDGGLRVLTTRGRHCQRLLDHRQLTVVGLMFLGE